MFTDKDGFEERGAKETKEWSWDGKVGREWQAFWMF